MQDREACAEWIDLWFQREGPKEQYFGFEIVMDDVSYQVAAEEETKQNRTPLSSRKRPKAGVWVVELKDGKIQKKEVEFNVKFEMKRDEGDAKALALGWAGNVIHFEKATGGEPLQRTARAVSKPPAEASSDAPPAAKQPSFAGEKFSDETHVGGKDGFDDAITPDTGNTCADLPTDTANIDDL